MTHLKRLLRDDRGASMVEYSILVGIITAASIGLIAATGTKVTGAWTTLDAAWL
jgi:pilus assembly protein Flp/PilA